MGALDGRPASGFAADSAEPADCYVLFQSHTDGLALHRALRGLGVGARIAPTPRAARSTCGMSLLVSCDDEGRIRAAAKECKARIEDVVRLENQIRPDRDRFC
ncbi:DUF3343 domain-containing protein [Raoultibacter phocaeensis]|uniref:DUF3343 domain-containing protein n=1 Tax=Raoultibacter phocaeensis TaxID=2479841 RepID=UPI00111ACDD9|nr:DUF3343 domain-containing protein [Raoultibacter phocaeensis]